MPTRGRGLAAVSRSHILWSSKDASYVPSAVLHGENLYWVSDQGIAYCMEAKTGKTVYRQRLPRTSGGFAAKPFFASIVLASDRLYAVSRTSGTFVLAAKRELHEKLDLLLESSQAELIRGIMDVLYDQVVVEKP